MNDRDKEDLKRQIELHTAGATVRYNSPFENLPSFKNEAGLSAEFITEWVIPNYMTIAHYDKGWISTIQRVKPNITKTICWQLLGDFNWRSRLVGCYFAGVNGYTDMIDTIGIHLLKSEVCCVGQIYALTLAFFNTSASTYFLDTYLNYYLAKPDLYFDQQYVMKALLYLDKINGSHHAEKHIQPFLNLMCAWNRPEAVPDIEYFDEQIPILKSLNARP